MANSRATPYVRSQAEQEFADWLDSVCTPVSTDGPIVDPSRDYAQEKHDKREAHRHRWLMQNNYWYRSAWEHHQKMLAEYGPDYVEPEPLEHGEQGFWEQFRKEQ
jgi:hypothetical protein